MDPRQHQCRATGPELPVPEMTIAYIRDLTDRRHSGSVTRRRRNRVGAHPRLADARSSQEDATRSSPARPVRNKRSRAAA
jgi:hypothetical protein